MFQDGCGSQQWSILFTWSGAGTRLFAESNWNSLRMLQQWLHWGLCCCAGGVGARVEAAAIAGSLGRCVFVVCQSNMFPVSVVSTVVLVVGGIVCCLLFL